MGEEDFKLKMVVKSWKVHKDGEEKGKTIGGVIDVMCGKEKVAGSGFNDGYNTTKIAIPPDLMSEVLALDEKIRLAIIDNYTG